MGPNDIALAKKVIKDYSKTLIDSNDNDVNKAAALPYQEDEEFEIAVNENLPMNPPEVVGPEDTNNAKRIRLM